MITDAVLDYLDKPHSVEYVILALFTDWGFTRDEIEDAMIELEKQGRIVGYWGWERNDRVAVVARC